MEYLLKFHVGLTGLDPRGCLRGSSSGLTTLNPLVINGLREYLSRFLSSFGDDEAADRALHVDVLVDIVTRQMSRLQSEDGIKECLRIIRNNILSTLYDQDHDIHSTTEQYSRYVSHTNTLAKASEDDILLSLRGFFSVHLTGSALNSVERVIRSHLPLLCFLNSVDLYRPLFKFWTALPMAYACILGHDRGSVGVFEKPKVPEFLPQGLTMDVCFFAILFPALPLFSRDIKIILLRLSQRLMELREDGKGASKRCLKKCFDLLRLKEIAPPVSYKFFVEELEKHRDLLGSRIKASGGKFTSRFERVCSSLVGALLPDIIRFQDLPNFRLSDRAGLVTLPDVETGFSVLKLKSGEGIRQLVRLSQQGRIGPIDLLDINSSGEVAYTSLRSDFDLERLYRHENYETKDVPTDEEDVFVRVTGQVADVVGLMEPLKVRVISITDAVLQSLGSRIQKHLWRRLKDLPCFSLIKGTEVEIALMSLDLGGLPQLDFLTGETLGQVSGDYSAATDKIPMSKTRFVAKEVLKRIAMPDNIRQDLINALCDVTLDYTKSLKRMYDEEAIRYLDSRYGRPSWNGRGDKFLSADIKSRKDELESLGIMDKIRGDVRVKQLTGQLMGNILSFPILCIINLACYLCIVEEFSPQETNVPYEAPGVFVWHRSQTKDALQPCSWIVDQSGCVTGSRPWPLSRLPRPGERLSDIRMVINPNLTYDQLKRLNLLVNGDDILFSSTQKFYEFWSSRIADYGGFHKSVGKNYFSSNFFTVNSQCFYYKRVPNPHYFSMDEFSDPHSYVVRKVEGTWFGGLRPDFIRDRVWLSQLSGKTDNFDQDPRRALAAVQQKFVRSISNDERVEQCLMLWFEANRPILDAFKSPDGHFSLNYFLPIALQGMGLGHWSSPIVQALSPLTTAQKILAGRMVLLLESGQPCPVRLFPSPLDNEKSRISHVLRRDRGRMIQSNQADGFDEAGRLRVKDGTYRLFEDLVQDRISSSEGPSWLMVGPNAFGERERLETRPAVDRLFRWSLRVRRPLAQKFIDELVERPNYPIWVVRGSFIRNPDMPELNTPSEQLLASVERSLAGWIPLGKRHRSQVESGWT